MSTVRLTGRMGLDGQDGLSHVLEDARMRWRCGKKIRYISLQAVRLLWETDKMAIIGTVFHEFLLEWMLLLLNLEDCNSRSEVCR